MIRIVSDQLSGRCSRWFRAALVCAVGGWLSVVTPCALAHDSPEHVIEHLTARMARQGRSAELLYRRASEYRSLGKHPAAARDLAAALELDADYQPARVELARVQLAQGQPAVALLTIQGALQNTNESSQRAPLLIIRSDIQATQKRTAEALADCEAACAERPAEVEWQLKRSYLLAALGRHDLRAGQLKTAYDETQSAVLKIEWIEALIDTGRTPLALAEIEAELNDSRWRSSWLLRRARARQMLGEQTAAAEDLQAAIREIDGRINPARPDGSLIGDRGLAYALLGDWQAAAQNLTQARSVGADGWMLERLAGLLAAHGEHSSSNHDETSR